MSTITEYQSLLHDFIPRPVRTENEYRRTMRQRRWSAYVYRTPDETELAAIRRSNETGLPYGERSWVERFCRRLKLDLTIRPRGRPQKCMQNEE